MKMGSLVLSIRHRRAAWERDGEERERERELAPHLTLSLEQSAQVGDNRSQQVTKHDEATPSLTAVTTPKRGWACAAEDLPNPKSTPEHGQSIRIAVRPNLPGDVTAPQVLLLLVALSTSKLLLPVEVPATILPLLLVSH